MSADKEKFHYFSSENDGMAVKIIVCSLVFHAALIGLLYALHCMESKPENELIPVFELVQVAPPTPSVPERPKPEVKEPEPEPEPPKVEPKPDPVEQEPLPEEKPELPPEPKPEVKPDPVPEEKPIEKPEPPKEKPKELPVAKKPKKEVKKPKRVEPEDDFPIDDLDLPRSFETSTLKPVGNIEMDPLMRAYLERLKQIIMSNFNPPGGLNVGRGSKSMVQFEVNSYGKISNVMLKRSSGNGTWDHLSVRAIQISKVPGLPPSYHEPNLVLHFNFTPN